MPGRPLPLLLTIAFLLALLSTGATPAANPAGGPTLAVEDTMHTDVAEVLVRAPRVTLDEILDRVARGEARRDSLLRDQTYLSTMRLLGDTDGKKQPRLLVETVSKVFKRKPHDARSITLRHYEWKPKPSKDDKPGSDDDDDADVSPGMGEEIVNFAFRPENRRNFRFTIEARKLLGDHLLYTLRFEPRSSLAAYEPSGRVWVDTKDFVILRQEIEFRQSPVPLFLKSIKHMVVERTRAGEFWVLSRMLVRIEFTVPLPRVGRAVDLAMTHTDYSVNTGLPDSLFVGTRKADGDSARVRVTIGGGRRKS